MLSFQSYAIDKTGNIRYPFSLMEMDIDLLIGANLTRIIDKHYGGNQSAFSKSLGINPTWINGVIHGKKNFGKAKIEFICKKMGLPLYEFFVDEKTPIIQNEQEQQKLYRHREEVRLGIVEEVARYEDYQIAEAKKKEPASGDLDLRIQRLRENAVKHKHEEKLEALIESMPDLAKKLRPKRRKKKVA